MLRLSRQLLCQVFGELDTGEGSVLEGFEDHRGGLLLLHSHTVNPPLLVAESCRPQPTDIDHEFARRMQMQRPPHRPRLDDRPLLNEGSFGVIDGQVLEASPESDAGHRRHLGLDAADIAYYRREAGSRRATLQMMPMHPKGGNLGVREGQPARSSGQMTLPRGKRFLVVRIWTIAADSCETHFPSCGNAPAGCQPASPSTASPRSTTRHADSHPARWLDSSRSSSTSSNANGSSR